MFFWESENTTEVIKNTNNELLPATGYYKVKDLNWEMFEIGLGLEKTTTSSGKVWESPIESIYFSSKAGEGFASLNDDYYFNKGLADIKFWYGDDCLLYWDRETRKLSVSDKRFDEECENHAKRMVRALERDANNGYKLMD